jgi:hypothetical protein
LDRTVIFWVCFVRAVYAAGVVAVSARDVPGGTIARHAMAMMKIRFTAVSITADGCLMASGCIEDRALDRPARL